MKPIQRGDLQFSASGNRIHFYYQRQDIGSHDRSYYKTSSTLGQEILDDLVKYKGDQDMLRRIREIQENRIFPQVYATFNDYVKDWPEAERSRAWITDSGKQISLILQGQGCHSGIPGGYLWAHVQHFSGIPAGDPPWAVMVHDCDDGCVAKDCMDETTAQRELDTLKYLTPFTFEDLTHLFDYRYN